jgi:hypothetical protein
MLPEIGYSSDMQYRVFVGIVFLTILISACPMQTDTDSDQLSRSADAVVNTRPPVLVELFTSEGCSSCPPADGALTFLERQQPVAKADIITLAFHVDYWDRLGWKDRFSSPLFSQRQEEYATALKLESSYTPQMIVDGRAEFVGSNSGQASSEILKATENAKARVEIVSDAGHVKVAIGDVPAHADSTVFAAIAEDGISSRVERGENSGKTLEHVSVVHELKTLGSIRAGDLKFDGALDVPANKDWKPENLKVVVFVQENESRKVIGVGRGKLAL